WPEEDAQALEETQLQARWPQGQRFQKIGSALFLVAGVEPPAANREPAPVPQQANPRTQAETLLAAARKAGDRPREASALTDLGIAHLRSGDTRRAVALLEEALVLAC